MKLAIDANHKAIGTNGWAELLQERILRTEDVGKAMLYLSDVFCGKKQPRFGFDRVAVKHPFEPVNAISNVCFELGITTWEA